MKFFRTKVSPPVKPYFIDSQFRQDSGNSIHFFKRKQLFTFYNSRSLRRHAVGTSQIATICNRQSKIGNLSFQKSLPMYPYTAISDCKVLTKRSKNKILSQLNHKVCHTNNCVGSITIINLFRIFLQHCSYNSF